MAPPCTEAIFTAAGPFATWSTSYALLRKLSLIIRLVTALCGKQRWQTAHRHRYNYIYIIIYETARQRFDELSRQWHTVGKYDKVLDSAWLQFLNWTKHFSLYVRQLLLATANDFAWKYSALYSAVLLLASNLNEVFNSLHTRGRESVEFYISVSRSKSHVQDILGGQTNAATRVVHIRSWLIDQLCGSMEDWYPHSVVANTLVGG